ncbi:hypothetical protein C8R46DRAFT_1343837 [Mycena filopes]|nr:hypothetical protein C8R46DRAFT_1010094 [Mycena filopes]KAJ7148349.1 hypothetical protein C8R46DRAFT_1010095 [Mycena filopes]KAJ7184841.1 hypothetical protein C8R46DRAFT_983954 [Mycena filopes]KAJ7184842.1 hypothetical protein C8R46DRAFT_1343837 [Mycena filopes]
MFSNTLLAFALASVAAVHAVDICGYSNTLGCSGSAICCDSLPAQRCCSITTAGFGFSVEYFGFPGVVSDGQAWTSSNCVAGPVFTDQIGTGNKCFVGGGPKINSVAWVNSASRVVNQTIEGSAVAPTSFRFTENGVEKSITIPAGEDAIDKLVALYKAKDFAGLAAYA